jgi:hypothetical protein
MLNFLSESLLVCSPNIFTTAFSGRDRIKQEELEDLLEKWLGRRRHHSIIRSPENGW